MADSPPPLDDVEFDQEEEVGEEPAGNLEPEEVGGDREPLIKPESEEKPLFAEMEQPPEETKSPEPITTFPAPTATLETTAAEESPEPEPVMMKPSPKLVEAASSRPLDLFEDEEDVKVDPEQEDEEEEEEEEEGGDTYEIEISVTNPAKVGDGMGAYIAYEVLTRTTMPSFKSAESSVKRRFSDFLGLSQRIAEKYMQLGRIVPPAPEKSVVGMTKVKFSKNDDKVFLQRRRAALERYLNRIAKHPVLRKDDDFKEFLENPADLPKASDTSALSGAGFMRLVKNVGESISKIAGKKAETDSWFDEQQQNFEVLDAHLRKLHAATETMINSRKEYGVSAEVFAKSAATLGNVEENDSVARALARLAEVEEKVESLHEDQFQTDIFVFGETVKDYISLLTSIKGTFQLRIKAYGIWQAAQTTLAKKREYEVKLQTGGKPEKLAQAKVEIEEWEKKVEEGQKSFDSVSKVLKKEVKRFETERAQEFKQKFVVYLESLMKLQQELVKLWEEYLPDAQAIA